MNNLVLIISIVLFNRFNCQRISHPRLMPVPPNFKDECSFYNRIVLKQLIENYLANKDKTCTKLNLCPKVPNWLKSKDVEWYEKKEEKEKNLSLIPSFRDGKPLHLFYKFFVDNISSMNLQHMVK